MRLDRLMRSMPTYHILQEYLLRQISNVSSICPQPGYTMDKLRGWRMNLYFSIRRSHAIFTISQRQWVKICAWWHPMDVDALHASLMCTMQQRGRLVFCPSF